jgi:hypothetical protein
VLACKRLNFEYSSHALHNRAEGLKSDTTSSRLLPVWAEPLVSQRLRTMCSSVGSQTLRSRVNGVTANPVGDNSNLTGYAALSFSGRCRSWTSLVNFEVVFRTNCSCFAHKRPKLTELRRCRAKTRCKFHVRFPLEKCAQSLNSSSELAARAQEAPPALLFRHPGNLIGEGVGYFGARLPIPK